MAQTLSTTRRGITVRSTVRRIPPLPDGTSHGYRVDYPDQRPRITYSPAQLTGAELGRLVHQLTAYRPVVTS